MKGKIDYTYFERKQEMQRTQILEKMSDDLLNMIC